MGVWGSGNFDSDTAADHLCEVMGRLVDEVAAAMAGDPVELEPDEYWGTAVPCNLELLTLIARQGHVGPLLPAPDVIAGWKEKYLRVWDATIDGLGPREGFKETRRAVLAATFDAFAAESAKDDRHGN